MMKKLVGMMVMVLALGQTRLLAGGGELIVFTDGSEQLVNADFRQQWMPKFQALAQQMGLGFRELDIASGAPEEVTATPAIFFQNSLGRSRYIGRYHYVDKVKTFIRTVSRMPQQSASQDKHDVLVWESGRAKVYSPVKITELGGSIPAKFDQEKFVKKALQALDKGADQFSYQAHFQAQRPDRAMYLALYPYRGHDGKFFLSAEVYSQFNCIEPLHRQFDQPFEGNWKDWEAVFVQAGKKLQTIVLGELQNLKKGDAMIPVASNIAKKSWDQLGLALPAPDPADSDKPAFAKVPIPSAWTVEGPVEDGSPMLSFSFLAPVDYYAGEAGKLFGDMRLGDQAALPTATGLFGIETASLTMGDLSLDHSVHGMLDIVDHPQAKFLFQSLKDIERPQLSFDGMSQFTVAGELELMGIKAPVEVRAQMEPFIGEDGQVRLQVTASFQLRLKERFGIDGPDGPQPAADTMQFLLNFVLKPA